jgi:hypothetical protein
VNVNLDDNQLSCNVNAKDACPAEPLPSPLADERPIIPNPPPEPTIMPETKQTFYVFDINKFIFVNLSLISPSTNNWKSTLNTKIKLHYVIHKASFWDETDFFEEFHDVFGVNKTNLWMLNTDTKQKKVCYPIGFKMLGLNVAIQTKGDLESGSVLNYSSYRSIQTSISMNCNESMEEENSVNFVIHPHRTRRHRTINTL